MTTSDLCRCRAYPSPHPIHVAREPQPGGVDVSHDMLPDLGIDITARVVQAARLLMARLTDPDDPLAAQFEELRHAMLAAMLNGEIDPDDRDSCKAWVQARLPVLDAP